MLAVAAIGAGAVLAGGDAGSSLSDRAADELLATTTPAATTGDPDAPAVTTPASQDSDRPQPTDKEDEPDAAPRASTAPAEPTGGGGSTDTPAAAGAREQAPAERTPSSKPARAALRLDGPRLPKVTATSTDGTVNFGTLRGPAVIHVFASWCPTCRAEAPAVAKALRAAPGVQPIYLAVADQPADSAAFVERYDWPAAPRVDDPGRELATKLGVDYQPNLILVDRAGRTQVIAGGVSQAKLTALLRALEA